MTTCYNTCIVCVWTPKEASANMPISKSNQQLGSHLSPRVEGHNFEQYRAHFHDLKARYDRLLEAHDMDVLAVHAGQPKRHFMDDSEYDFRVNPHFKAICPLVDAPHSWVIMRQGAKPTLILFAPEDFWHEVVNIDDADWLPLFHVELITTPSDIERFIPYNKDRVAYLGEHIEVAQALGIMQVNPESLLHSLHYHRVFKSDYELQCIATANRIAAAGHEAVEAAFYAGRSEFECWLAYMQATQQGPTQAPYQSIVAQNQHAAILHYRGKSTQPLHGRLKSLMIDAGASYRGYASDISRSYSFSEQQGEHAVFAELVKRVDALTLELVDWVRPHRYFGSIQEQAHYGVAQILLDFGWVKGLSLDQMIDERVTYAFMPHSFGHMLGLQVHDVGGNLEDASGKASQAPERFPNLRTNRKIEPRQVVTIEPGVYFIDALLQPFGHGPLARHFDWQALDAMRDFGGVRIEDNIVVTEHGASNLTRAQGLR
ncbi:Xaa-Pro dipeptidase [Aliidiomarina maris]|uniref:Xaa-Pro dipeptidase n=2 Tax=Aliidiomarina maris TaxID=531312 RepID=A0ABY0BRC2_9GAMM|nr:Xaa-Pro dipeptidase [Aliidiomarina maris]